MIAGSDVVGLARTRAPGKTKPIRTDPILSRSTPPTSSTQALCSRHPDWHCRSHEVRSAYGAHLAQTIKVLTIYGGSLLPVQLRGCGAERRSWSESRRVSTTSQRGNYRHYARYLVLDEGDEMLQMGFAEDVERPFADTPEYAGGCSPPPCRCHRRSPRSICTSR